MNDFRALCQELMDAIDSGISTERIKQSSLAVRVDAALAQTETEPLDDSEGLCCEFLLLTDDDESQELLAKTLRTALAQSKPTPTDEELMAVFWEHENGLEEIWACDWPAAARAVLARWGNA